MKNKMSIIYCVVFFSIILAPLVLMPLGGNELTENRPPAPPPELIVDGSFNLNAPLEAEDFFRDRFAGRTLMIEAYSNIVGGVFGVSSNEKVIMGSDGWLFFAETVGDYDGSAALDDEQMGQLIQVLLDMKNEAEARGQVFIIAVAPNKNTLYGEYMPRGYKQADVPSNLERLLAVEELDCLDLGSVLMEAERAFGQEVYFKTDSHWNSLGARVAVLEIMAAVEERTKAGGIDVQEPSHYWISGGRLDYAEPVVITGDLAQMLYPVNPPKEMDMYYWPLQDSFTAIGRFRTLDDLHITTESDGIDLRIAMYRDSFANALIPHISSIYANVYYTRQTPPPMDADAFVDADVIIFQIAERRLPELLE